MAITKPFTTLMAVGRKLDYIGLIFIYNFMEEGLLVCSTIKFTFNIFFAPRPANRQ